MSLVRENPVNWFKRAWQGKEPLWEVFWICALPMHIGMEFVPITNFVFDIIFLVVFYLAVCSSVEMCV